MTSLPDEVKEIVENKCKKDGTLHKDTVSFVVNHDKYYLVIRNSQGHTASLEFPSRKDVYNFLRDIGHTMRISVIDVESLA